MLLYWQLRLVLSVVCGIEVVTVDILVLFQILAGTFQLSISEYYFGYEFVINSFNYVKIWSLRTQFDKSFYHECMLNFIKCFFFSSTEMIIFLFFCWFSKSHLLICLCWTILVTLDEPNLVVVYYLCVCVLLDLIC